MSQCSLRVFILNTITLIMSVTNLEENLKILLLVISIVYTLMKIYDWVMAQIKGKKPNNE